MKKVAVIGHYGFGFQCLDGQTIKTKIITEELEERFGKDDVKKIDTHGGKRVLFKLFLKSGQAMCTSKNVIIFPASNGLKFFVPVLLFFKMFFKAKLHYVVIGGWLPMFLARRKILQAQLKKFDNIYVETNLMKKSLDKMGFSNITVMPNCKKLKILKPEELVYPTSEPYKLCTFSRVMKEKGIEDAVNAVKAVNNELGRTVYTLDIYGQVDNTQTEWFESLKQTFPDYVKYGGMVQFDRSVEVLKNYFTLLFPTYYEGEGFAGTIIDAISAGVPIVASDWKYNSEIVSEHIGYLFRKGSVEALTEQLILITKYPEKLIEKKKNCIVEAQRHNASFVLKNFIMKLE